MKMVAFFAFKGDALCFNHLLLNAIDLKENGNDAKIIFEGEAVKLPKEFQEKDHPLFKKAKEMGILDCICKACSQQFGVLEYNEKTGIPIKGDMKGHPSMRQYMDRGYEVITL
jgi:hypothetical protein